ncbi:MAG: hypothetical protein IT362_11190, partial [Deltaproteobacteria bacterium]|nr:hypothetical protein [Deltaproteobacteria bacterium]
MSGLAGTNEKTIEVLLDIADWYGKQRRKVENAVIQTAVDTLLTTQPFNEYGLDDKEIKIIAILFGRLFEEDSDKLKEARTVLMRLEEDRKSSFLFIR